MSRVKLIIVIAIAAAFSVLAISSLYANAKIAKETGKTCTHCHTKAGSAELNDVGKCYKEKKKSLDECTK